VHAGIDPIHLLRTRSSTEAEVLQAVAEQVFRDREEAAKDD